MIDSAAPVRISACICTRNRPEELASALRSLEDSSLAVEDVIVADDSTDERTEELLRLQFPRVTYVPGPRRGLCANRNVAAAAARGTHLFFLDDDARLGARTLERFVDALAGAAAPERARTIVTGRELNAGREVCAKEQDFLGYQRRAYEAGRPMRTIVINTTLFPTAAVRNLRFDEQLVYGYDEVDFTTRATAAGYRIAEVPGACNEHFPSKQNRAYYRPHIDSARLYVTFKRYLWTDRRRTKAAAYALIAPLHLIIHRLQRGGVRSIPDSLATIARALRCVGVEMRSRRSRVAGASSGEFAPRDTAHEIHVCRP